MENEEVITVENKNNQGNPNHKPAGSPDGGQFTSAGGTGSGTSSNNLKSSLLDFIKKKQAAAEPKVTFDNIAACFGLGCSLKKEHMKKSFENGTPEAQQLVDNFFKTTKTKIFNAEKGKTAHWSVKWRCVCFNNQDLQEELGKHSGFHAPGDTFYHEVFHAMDDMYGSGGNEGILTANYELSNGKTLKETFHDEIAIKKYSWNTKLYDEIKSDYEKCREEELRKNFTEEQIKDFEAKKEYYRKALFDLNYEFGKHNHISDYPSVQAYNDAWNEYNTKFKQLKKEWKQEANKMLPAVQSAQRQYLALSDFCSFIYKTGIGKQSICGGHPKTYWSSNDGNRPIQEMWANLGSMWARGDTEGLARMEKYFPDTVKGFKELVGKLDHIRKARYGL